MLHPMDLDETYIYQYRIIFKPDKLNGTGQWINCNYAQFMMYKNLVGVFRRDGYLSGYSYTYEVRSMKVHEVFGVDNTGDSST